jgi:hypothetical protein
MGGLLPLSSSLGEITGSIQTDFWESSSRSAEDITCFTIHPLDDYNPKRLQTFRAGKQPALVDGNFLLYYCRSIAQPVALNCSWELNTNLRALTPSLQIHPGLAGEKAAALRPQEHLVGLLCSDKGKSFF